MNMIDLPDRVFSTVHSGDTEDVLPCHFYDIDPEKVLRIGDIRDFDWELDSDYGIEGDWLGNDTATTRVIEHVKAYMAKHVYYPFVPQLWEELTGFKDERDGAADIVIRNE